jgi:hypothetical protein
MASSLQSSSTEEHISGLGQTGTEHRLRLTPIGRRFRTIHTYILHSFSDTQKGRPQAHIATDSQEQIKQHTLASLIPLLDCLLIPRLSHSVRPASSTIQRTDHHPARARIRFQSSIRNPEQASHCVRKVEGGPRTHAPVVHGGAPRPDGRLRPIGGLRFPAELPPAFTFWRFTRWRGSCATNATSLGQAYQSDACTSSHCFLNESCTQAKHYLQSPEPTHS